MENGVNGGSGRTTTANKQQEEVVASSSSNRIRAGDLVVVFYSRDRAPVPLTVTPGEELTNTFGIFAHDDMIGRPFGAKLASRNHRGFIHLLRPNSELWTLALPHRTQILYTPDMSFIASHLGLSPGARLIEAGTGSGSFTHFATRCVARKHAQSCGVGWQGQPLNKRSKQQQRGGGRRQRDGAGALDEEDDGGNSEEEQASKVPVDDHEADVLEQLRAAPDTFVGPREGRVWSFEFHAGRAIKAWDEFYTHKLFPTVSLRHRNVVKEGFGLHDAADAVFLDLPAPWDALSHAARAMRRDVAGRICCFSPCVEQVLKTVAALRKGQDADPEAAGGEPDEVRWTDIETYECLHRTHLSLWCGPNTPVPLMTIDDAIERIQDVEERKGKRRAMQIERARKERQQQKEEEEEEEDDDDDGDDSLVVVQEEKRSVNTAEQEGDVNPMPPSEHGQKRKRDEENGEGEKVEDEDDSPVRRANVVSRPFPEMRGHTSYLTFATLVPRLVERAVDPTLEKEREQARRKEAAAERSRIRKEEEQKGFATSS